MRLTAVATALFASQTAWATNVSFVSLTGPNAPQAGANQTFTATLANNGTAFTSSFSITLRASADEQYDAGDAAICTETILGGFGPTQQRQFTLVCAWPAVVPGPYVVASMNGVSAAPISDSNPADNSTFYGPIQVPVPATPDLSVDQLLVSSPHTPGASLTVSYRLLNSGTGSAAGSRTALWWSTDTVLDGGDSALCQHIAPAMASGSQATYAIHGCSVPPGLATNTYYVLAQADADAAVSESQEGNNQRSSPVDVVVPVVLPDLQLAALSAPAQTSAGAQVTVSYTATNQGPGPSAQAALTLRAAPTSTYDASAPLMCTETVPAMSSGQSRPLNVTCTVPAQAPLGAGYLVATLDEANVIAESDELNNSRAHAWTLTVIQPGDLADLTIPAAGGVPEVPAGHTFSVSYTLLNDGQGSAPTSTTRAWLSSDGAVDASDVLLCEDVIPAVNGVSSAARTLAPCTVPANAAPGTWHLLLQTDALGAVVESDEANNVYDVGLVVRAAPVVIPTDTAEPADESDMTADSDPPDSDVVVDSDTDDGSVPTEIGTLGCRCAGAPGPRWGWAWVTIIAWTRRRSRS